MRAVGPALVQTHVTEHEVGIGHSAAMSTTAEALCMKRELPYEDSSKSAAMLPAVPASPDKACGVHIPR
eukprot:72082-Pleurochrysis_carterae.AAC.5